MRQILRARATDSLMPASDLESRIAQGRVKHDLNGNWQLSVGVLDQLVERDISTQVNALTDNAGNYTASLASGFAPRFRVFSNLSHVNGRVTTGRVTHDVAIGVAGYTFKTYSDVTNPPAASVRLGTANIASPVVFGLPPAGIPTHDNLFVSSVIHQQGFSIADNVVLGGGWSVRAALSQDWIWTDNFNNAGVRTGGYDADGVSPLVSVMYKPQPRMTVYATVGSSLQQGDVAPGTAVNSGQALAPYRIGSAGDWLQDFVAVARLLDRVVPTRVGRSRRSIRRTTSSGSRAIS